MCGVRLRYGPPPSYPNLKIQGLNAPIPEGCRFGYEPGEWGKPPVDAYGRPIYGDVFGSAHKSSNPWEAAVDKSLRWGDLQVRAFHFLWSEGGVGIESVGFRG